MNDLSNYRKSYEKSELNEQTIPSGPIELFTRWFAEAEESKTIDEANAMTISTTGTDGFPKARVVLLKKFSEEGFVFYTNYDSEKGRAIAADARVCLSFFWPGLERQVIIKGIAEKTSAEDSDAYFASRPEGSRLGAIASPQSRVVPSREFLDHELQSLKSANHKLVRPQHWGGYIVRPISIEFWQGRANRMHDRIRFTAANGPWIAERLAP